MCRTCRFVTQVYMWLGGLLHPSTCHLHSVYHLKLSLPNHLTSCYPSSSPTPPNRPQCVMFPSLCPCVLIVQLLLMSENMLCLVFYSCVSLLRMMVSSFIQVSTKDINSPFFMAVQYSIVHMYHNFFIQSIIDGHWVGSKSLLL